MRRAKVTTAVRVHLHGDGLVKELSFEGIHLSFTPSAPKNFHSLHRQCMLKDKIVFCNCIGYYLIRAGICSVHLYA